MNNIQEKDWAEDSWGGHTGMGNFSDDYDDIRPEMTDTLCQMPGLQTLDEPR